MKNIFYIVLLVVSAKMYSQQNNDITKDELYLKYENAYLNINNQGARALGNLDEVSSEFYNKFQNPKVLESFSKSKDKMKWLNKNSNKTLFTNAQEALNSYTNFMNLKESYTKNTIVLTDLLNQLKLKYDGLLIWNTLKSRIQ